MNAVMEGVTFVDPKRNVRQMKILFVPNRLIRLVQVPKEVDIAKGLREWFDPNGTRGRGRSSLGRRFRAECYVVSSCLQVGEGLVRRPRSVEGERRFWRRRTRGDRRICRTP